MLRLRVLSLVLLGLSAAALAQPQALGLHGFWGAFRDPAGARCYAIAEPTASTGNGRPHASIGYWPRRGVSGQVHFRLSRARRLGSAALLRIDGRTFQLVGGGTEAWANGLSADAQIVAAMRTGISMAVEARAPGGLRIRDAYALKGAATAIDAAALACAGARWKNGAAGPR